mmetsp:Transcript_68449/g.164360  ORF Transcript_68449/g.164360 Transcript_68449/m.164360 type:complete len:201 (+) Transcript_68449:935-1537(+)
MVGLCSSAPADAAAALPSSSVVRCCKNRASWRAKPSAESCCGASATPSSRQWPGHFCTTQNFPGSTMLDGSDSTQSSTLASRAALANRRCSRCPSGSRKSSCTTSGAAAGSSPSSAAFFWARSTLSASLAWAACCARSSAALASSAACISASVCSLGSMSTSSSVSSRASRGSGASSRTTNSYVTPLCRIGSQSPSVRAM